MKTRSSGLLLFVLLLTPVIVLLSGYEAFAAVETSTVVVNTAGSTIHLSDDAELLDSGQCGDNVYWKYERIGHEEPDPDDYWTEKVLTIYGEGPMKDYTGYKENQTGPWYPSCKKLQRIVIDEGVTSVGNYAFCGLKYISDISISGTVKKIGKYSFYNSYLPESVDIPGNVESIGNYAFAMPDNYYVSEKDVPPQFTFHEGLKSIGKNVFGRRGMHLNGELPSTLETSGFLRCDNKELTVPAAMINVKNIFGECYDLEKVNFHDKVTELGEAAFQDCCSLRSITIPDSVTTIRGWTFVNCSKLQNVEIPGSVTLIEDRVFMSCYKLKHLTLPEGLVTIGDEAFADCGIETINIPSTVKTIGKGAFEETYMKTMKIPSTVKSVGKEVFSCCPKLTSVEFPGTLKKLPEAACENCRALKSVKLGEGIEVIDKDAFLFCGKLNSLTVPASVKKIGKRAFGDSNVKTITIKTSKLTRKSVRGSLIRSKVKTIKVNVGSKSKNKNVVKKYKKIFTAKNAGKSVTVI